GADAFDSLQRTGQQALDSGGEAEARLALALADEATALRARSKGAWRLRGNALDALGRGGVAGPPPQPPPPPPPTTPPPPPRHTTV
ncbi:hypothetical protein ACFV9B_44915, partial [Kitasatospora purpeofusca]